MKFVTSALRWLPALFILCCSWYLSSQPTLQYMPGFWNADKVVHCICFAGFAFWIAFGLGLRLKVKLRIVLPILLIALYAVVDELHQSHTPGRSCSVFDWLADVSGATIGSFVFYFVSQKIVAWWQKRKERLSSERA